jgi:predicted ATP-grasp superfamily ATP-dependent carboligase
MFVYLSRQIPALEARDILVTMEGSGFAYSGTNTPQAQKRFKELQELISSGVKI